MEKGPDMSRRRFLGGAIAAGAALVSNEALAQELPLNVLERIGKDAEQQAAKFSTLLASPIAQGSPDQISELKRLETLQKEMMLGVVYHLKFIVRHLEITKGSPIKRDIENHAGELRFKAQDLIDDEKKLQAILMAMRQTPELVHISNERKRIIGSLAVPISEALPNAAAVRNLVK